MFRYVVRRILNTIPLLLIITVVTFFIINLAPGDPVKMFLNPEAKTQVDLELIRHELGLDKPLIARYFIWLGNIIKGDFGISYFYGKPVIDILSDVLPNTIVLPLWSMVFSLVVAIPIGIFCAVKRNGILDYFFSIIAFLGVSIPGFWFALMLILVFSLKLGWFPTSGMREIYDHYDFLDRVKHMILPVFVLGTGSMASNMRYMRSAMLDVLTQDYIRTARAKGASELRVIFKHALRNALLPVATLIGFMIPGLVAGAAVIEAVFAWPGLGRVLVEANFTRDYPIIMGELIVYSLMVVAGSLASDILYAVVDPRIKLG